MQFFVDNVNILLSNDVFASDNDEIIVPIKHKDWHDMFDESEKEDKMVGAFNWDNFYFVKVAHIAIATLSSLYYFKH